MIVLEVIWADHLKEAWSILISKCVLLPSSPFYFRVSMLLFLDREEAKLEVQARE